MALFVIPVFAPANAGIPVGFNTLPDLWSDSLGLGIMFGLVAGKAIGISLLAWLSLRLTPERLLPGVNMRHIVGIAILGGIGFTMSIFISRLGFENAPEALVTAKTAVLLASLVAGLSGYLWLRFCTPVDDQV